MDIIGRRRTGGPGEWKPDASAPRTRPTRGAHSCSLTTHKHGRLASSHTSSPQQAFLSLHVAPEPADLSHPVSQHYNYRLFSLETLYRDKKMDNTECLHIQKNYEKKPNLNKLLDFTNTPPAFDWPVKQIAPPRSHTIG